MYPQSECPITETFGAKSSFLTFDANETIKQELQFDIETSAPELIAKFRQYQYAMRVAYIFWILPIIVLLILVLIQSQTNTLLNNNASEWELFAILFIFILATFLYIYSKYQCKKISKAWQFMLLQNLKMRISEWKCMFSEFTFTVIYPIYAFDISCNNLLSNNDNNNNNNHDVDDVDDADDEERYAVNSNQNHSSTDTDIHRRRSRKTDGDVFFTTKLWINFVHVLKIVKLVPNKNKLIGVYFYIRITFQPFASSPIEPIYAQTQYDPNQSKLEKLLNDMAIEVIDELPSSSGIIDYADNRHRNTIFHHETGNHNNSDDDRNGSEKVRAITYPVYVNDNDLSSSDSSDSSTTTSTFTLDESSTT
jgi:hypothetical protein